jgi:hypothetical protein
MSSQPIYSLSRAWLLCLLLITGTASAQVYTFLESKALYKPLTAYKSVDPAFALQSFEPIDIGFPFRYFDKTYSSLWIMDGFISFTPVSGDYDVLFPFYTDLTDLNPLVANSTQVNYALSGTAGSRVLTIEYKLAGILQEELLIGYVNFQVRLYEKNGDIEFHYGPHFINSGYEPYQEIGIYRFGNGIKGMGLYGRAEDVFITNQFIDDFPYPMNGIPAEGTVYRFGFDRNLVWNNFGDLGWELINQKTDRIGVGNMGFVRTEMGGALLGHNKFKDLEFAEKYHLSEKAVIKGMVTQNYGAAHSTDSASFSIYAVAPDGLPGPLLLQQKKPYSCLDFSGKMNFIPFDQNLTVSDSFFVAFGLSPYTRVAKDTVGLYYSLADKEERTKYRYGNVAFRWFNKQWYDVLHTRTISNRTTVINFGDMFGGDSFDLIHLAACPVVNFNLDNTSLITGNLVCRPSGNKTEAHEAITENFVEHHHLKLHPHFPNPANTHTYINFTLREATPVSLQVYDTKGTLVLHSEHVSMPEGFHQLYLDTSTLKAGMYTYIIRTSQSLLSSKIIIQP